MDLTHYRTLGRSGLAVSPLALGTMTFGTARWGLDEDGSRAVFDAYVAQGGNFVDTADIYASGASETMLGRFVAERGLRDQIVVSTKSGFAAGSGPHAGGCGAKHVHAAIDGSLRRLGTDYVRPVLAARLGRTHAGGGTARDDGRPRSVGQDPLLGLVEYSCLVRGQARDPRFRAWPAGTDRVASISTRS